MINVSHLSKRYGLFTALDDITFSVEGSCVVGFLGPNGAGKSSTMNILTGYLSATDGTVLIGGHNILDEPNQAKSLIGYLPEMPPLYMDMTVREYLSFIFDLKKIRMPKEEHIKQICKKSGILDVSSRLIANLSKGYRQRVGLAQALLGDPPLLILDEPTVGLDPKQIIEIRNFIKELGKEHTVLLSSHILPEIEATCSRILVVNHGRLVADGNPESLCESMEKPHLQLILQAPRDEALSALRKLPSVKVAVCSERRENGSCLFSIEEKDDARREIFSLCKEQDWPILDLHSHEQSLEQVFLRLTSGEYDDGHLLPKNDPSPVPSASADSSADSKEGSDQE